MNTRFNEDFQFAPADIGNASVKILLKDFIFDAYIETREAFREAKISEKLNFFKSIIPYVCAKQPANSCQGEWVPDKSMNYEWINDWIYRKAASKEKDKARDERLDNIDEYKKMIEIETINWRKEFYRMAYLIINKAADDAVYNKVVSLANVDNFKEEFSKAIFDAAIKELRKCGFEPPQPVRIFDRTVYPSEEHNASVKQDMYYAMKQLLQLENKAQETTSNNPDHSQDSQQTTDSQETLTCPESTDTKDTQSNQENPKSQNQQDNPEPPINPSA